MGRIWPVLIALVVSLPFLVVGINWGLPSRAADPYLFGGRAPWTGAEIVRLAGGWSEQDGARGADVQRDSGGGGEVLLNGTDAQRAEIVRRYRLYTYQPDEMINLRALSLMRPGQLKFDPHLYQYGGVWFYSAGVLLKACDVAGWVRLKPDVAYYLDHSEEAGRIYVVLRCLTVLFALAGVAAVYVLVRQVGGAAWLAGLMGMVWACSPGVVVFSHEAKPHLAGVSLTLWSLVAAGRFVMSGKRAGLAGSVVLAGLAFGSVLSALPVVLVPAAAIALQKRWRLWPVLLLFPVTYFVTNPYVLKHLLLDPSALGRQLGNTGAMYGLLASVSSAVQTAFFLLMSLTPACVLVLPAIGAAMNERRVPRVMWLYVPVGAASLVLFVAFAAFKPGEYARFGLLASALSIPVAGYLATRFRRAVALPVTVMLFHVLMSGPELMGYWSDAGGATSRLEFAQRFRSVVQEGETVRIRSEPAPYNMPPVDLWKYRLELGLGGEGVVLAQPPQSDGYWRMSWADRGFSVSEERVDKGGGAGR